MVPKKTPREMKWKSTQNHINGDAWIKQNNLKLEINDQPVKTGFIPKSFPPFTLLRS